MSLSGKLTLVFSFLLTTMLAQNTLVRSGVKACRAGDFEVAIEELTQALEHKGEISTHQLPRAYYYRAHARMLLLRQLGEGGGPQERLSRYAGTHLLAFDDLREAAFTDKGKYSDRIRDDRQLLFQLLLDEALRRIEYGRRDDISVQRREQAYREARRFLQTAARMDDAHYLLQDLTAQVHLGLGDYEKALTQFREAIQTYRRKPPEKPDLMFAYSFYRKALIHYHYRYLGAAPGVVPGKYDIDQALESVRQGLALLASEYERATKGRHLSVPSKGYLRSLNQEIRRDLFSLELDLYLHAPDRYNEALRVFAGVVEKEPEQYLYQIAYGQLLELSSQEKAAEIYQRAISLAPNRLEAYFNLGTMYFNEASRKSALAKEEERIKLYAGLMEESRELLRQARPFFEKAHRIEPGNLTVLNALMKICVVLGDAEAYQGYRFTKWQVLTR